MFPLSNFTYFIIITSPGYKTAFPGYERMDAIRRYLSRFYNFAIKNKKLTLENLQIVLLWAINLAKWILAKRICLDTMVLLMIADNIS